MENMIKVLEEGEESKRICQDEEMMNVTSNETEISETPSEGEV